MASVQKDSLVQAIDKGIEELSKCIEEFNSSDDLDIKLMFKTQLSANKMNACSDMCSNVSSCFQSANMSTARNLKS